MAHRFRNENKIRWRISVWVNFSFIYFSISNQNTLVLKWELMNEDILKNFHFQLHQDQVQITYLREVKSTFISVVSIGWGGGVVFHKHTHKIMKMSMCEV